MLDSSCVCFVLRGCIFLFNELVIYTRICNALANDCQSNETAKTIRCNETIQ